jgi:hypothetical protein
MFKIKFWPCGNVRDAARTHHHGQSNQPNVCTVLESERPQRLGNAYTAAVIILCEGKVRCLEMESRRDADMLGQVAQDQRSIFSSGD